MYIRNDDSIRDVPPFYSGVTVPSVQNDGGDGRGIDASADDAEKGGGTAETAAVRCDDVDGGTDGGERAASDVGMTDGGGINEEKPDVRPSVLPEKVPSVSDFEDVIPRFKRAPLETMPDGYDCRGRPVNTSRGGTVKKPLFPTDISGIELDRLLIAAILILFIAENGFDLSDDLPLILGLLAII